MPNQTHIDDVLIKSNDCKMDGLTSKDGSKVVTLICKTPEIGTAMMNRLSHLGYVHPESEVENEPVQDKFHTTLHFDEDFSVFRKLIKEAKCMNNPELKPKKSATVGSTGPRVFEVVETTSIVDAELQLLKAEGNVATQKGKLLKAKSKASPEEKKAKLQKMIDDAPSKIVALEAKIVKMRESIETNTANLAKLNEGGDSELEELQAAVDHSVSQVAAAEEIFTNLAADLAKAEEEAEAAAE